MTQKDKQTSRKQSKAIESNYSILHNYSVYTPKNMTFWAVRFLRIKNSSQVDSSTKKVAGVPPPSRLDTIGEASYFRLVFMAIDGSMLVVCRINT